MATVLHGATLFTPKEIIERGAVIVSDEGKITFVGRETSAPRADGIHIDLGGRILAPGFIDIHVHGGKGVMFEVEGDVRSLLRDYSNWVPSTGVTGFLCSIAAPTGEALVRGIEAYVHALRQGGYPGAEPLGLHLEGPFLNREKKGAFNPAWLRPVSLEEIEACLQAGQGMIRQVTLAPELPGAVAAAERVRNAGAVAALGHTNADYAGASAALRGGWAHVTHTFNAQRGFDHRAPGVFGAVLGSDVVMAELIADTFHVHPGAMKVLVRCLGADRIVLITDAIAGAGQPDGEYTLVGQQVRVEGGRATLADGTLAGSVTMLNRCVRNMHREVGVPLLQAVQMASLNPARAIGLAERLGSIAVGKDASLTAMDEDANVSWTMVRGQVVHDGR